MNIPVILTIAGSDCSGGAGVQADLKTITLCGGYGASVITALTAQNTCGVFGIEPVKTEFVLKQLEVVLEDLPVQSIKTGMLFSADIIEGISSVLKKNNFNLVVDPVCVSQSGHKLLEESAIFSFKKYLFPLATIITPNIPEAELFTGIPLRGEKDYDYIFEKFFDLGAKAVLLKGGHLEDKIICDRLALSSGEVFEFKSRKIETKNNHGTGCTLSAAISTFLGHGFTLKQSVELGRKFLLTALAGAYSLGQGHGPVNHLASWLREQAKQELIEDFRALRLELQKLKGFPKLIPEVRTNIVCALPFAEDKQHVLGFDGRISVKNTGELIFGEIIFGASSHMANVVLTALKFDSSLRWAINIRYNQNILEAIEKSGHTIFWFNRKDEPKEVKEQEGSTLVWGVAKVFRENSQTNINFIADPGDIGKEPIVRILASNKKELLAFLKDILFYLN
ncbi:hydroxymethylpyrimidine/phosphomethylpyrimidine kinase [Desulfonauticus submarinus]|uniref:hydroxymethylpyrimidine kinase n=1 Tax=Desulfonauticus submarinus TaxID=206665 RepID=A0A1H0CEQ2_9BACT|nr:bifunctional hydroxymethylpyrimidine kinase/phosphomethylpyrimidine kinase [Desulfonauticus submarinus]SDN56251.1 hydroxymethylpyrimidine/phosphomethylpyrimidine kinase [Desulfonauticus submarinus]